MVAAVNWVIAVVVIFVVVLFFAKPARTVSRVLLKGAVGSAAMMAVNALFAPMGIVVGVNFLTALAVGLLGIPGFVSLYIMQAFL